MAAEDFENRQQLRTEELEAIAKATEILKSGSVTGMADKHLPALAQTAFPLLRSEAVKKDGHASVSAVSRFLTGKAAKTGSKLLSLVAQKVGLMAKAMGGADPFAKVKKMIQDMIAQLMDQANDEADHNEWCTTELGTNKATRDAKSDGVDQLTSQKEILTAEIAKLDEEISTLTTAIAEINAAVAKATINRQEEKATNEQTIADAKEARAAVAHATAVLKEFYRKAAAATALVQGPKKNPFQKAYKGMGGESGGVVGMLDVIESDFARLQMDTETEEETSDTEFRRFSDASDTDKAAKTQMMKDRSKMRNSKKNSLTDTVANLKAMQEELDTALSYYDKLKPSCVDSGQKYEERVARREAEIQGLEESLRVLEGQDLP
jgi:chromosome segregation ATPase